MEFDSQIQSMVLSLAAVVALMLVLAWAAKALRSRTESQGCDLKVIGATHIGPKERIVLVRVRDRELLIGVGPQSLTALGEFDALAQQTESEALPTIMEATR